MNLGTALSVGEALAVGLIGFLSIIWSRRAADSAKAADHQTRNTGNGWAAHVVESLERIEERLALLDRRITGLEERSWTSRRSPDSRGRSA